MASETAPEQNRHAERRVRQPGGEATLVYERAAPPLYHTDQKGLGAQNLLI